MKNQFLLGLICLITVSVNAQKNETPLPEFVNSFNLLDTAGKLTPLEKQRMSGEAKVSASTFIVGVGKVSGRNVVKGYTSPIKVEGSSPSLVVRLVNNKIEPTSIINVFKLTSDKQKDRRFILANTTGTFSGSKQLNIEFLPFDAKPIGTDGLLIKLNNLSSGEYALTLDGSRDFFQMFSVN